PWRKIPFGSLCPHLGPIQSRKARPRREPGPGYCMIRHNGGCGSDAEVLASDLGHVAVTGCRILSVSDHNPFSRKIGIVGRHQAFDKGLNILNLKVRIGVLDLRYRFEARFLCQPLDSVPREELTSIEIEDVEQQKATL